MQNSYIFQLSWFIHYYIDSYTLSRLRVTRCDDDFEFSRGTKLRRKEKDSRNSSLPRRTFLGRVVRRGGGVSGCCRIDPIHHGGIYIPPLVPVLRCLLLSLTVSLSLLELRLDLAVVLSGWFLPCGRLCRYFPGGACASISLLATTPALKLPGPPRSSLLSSHVARRCNGHCLRVKSFRPPSETTYSASVAGSMTVVYTIFGTSDRTIGEFLRRRHARKGIAASIWRARATIERDLLSRLRFESFHSKHSCLLKRKSFRMLYFYEILRSCAYSLYH